MKMVRDPISVQDCFGPDGCREIVMIVMTTMHWPGQRSVLKYVME